MLDNVLLDYGIYGILFSILSYNSTGTRVLVILYIYEYEYSYTVCIIC